MWNQKETTIQDSYSKLTMVEMKRCIRVIYKVLTEGWNRGFDPTLRKLFIKSSLDRRHVLEPILKVG